MSSGLRLLAFFSFVLLFFFIQFSCQSDSGVVSDIKEDSNQLDTLSLQEELGRSLFFDRRLSIDSTVSCATCHIPERAFTDGHTRSKGIKGRRALRNAPSLLNVGELHFLMYDGAVPSLEQQALVPIGDSNEMGTSVALILERLSKDKTLNDKSRKAFNRSFDAYALTRSLAAFQRTLISTNSSFDKWRRGEGQISESAQTGWKLFSEKLACIECHALPHFTNGEIVNNGFTERNAKDQGRFRITGKGEDKGKFKVPSLRNIALTGPYMHDGSLKSLDAVLDHYVSQRNHERIDPRVQKIKLSNQDRLDLIEFFNSLTDSSSVSSF